MRAVAADEVEIGTVLAWPVFDDTGKLLLGQGMQITCQAQLDMLVSRGRISAAARDPRLARPQRSPPPRPKIHLLVPSRPAAPEPTGVFDGVLALKSPLQAIHQALIEAASPTLAADVLALARRLRALVAQDADAALAAMQLDTSDDGHIARQIHAAILCQLAAQAQRVDAERSESIMAAALTYDVALGPIADALNRQDTGLTPAQRERIDAHPGDGVVLLQAAGVTDPVWLDAVLHHHERIDGSGYPHGLAGGEIWMAARMLAIVDIFSAMVRPRAWRGARQARHALRELFLERGNAVDDALPGLLIKEIGVFPPGTVVQLASGEVGVVLRRGGNAAHPLVARLVNANGTFAAVARQRDTANADNAIVDTVPQARYGAMLADAGRLWSQPGRPAR